MTPSIRTFLLINLLLSVTLITSLAIIGNLFLAHKDIQTQLDLQLIRTGKQIHLLLSEDITPKQLTQIQENLDHSSVFLPQEDFKGDRLKDNIEFQVWRNNQLVLHSKDAPLFKLSPSKLGLSTIWVNQQSWRIFSMEDRKGYQFMVGEQTNFRQHLENQITQDSVLIMLITYPFLGILIWMIVGRGLASIRRVARGVRNRAATYLEPIALDDIPAEIQPLIKELNKLFNRLKESFDREKRFASDAAHELRTPLAALKTQVQVAERCLNEEDRKHSLKKVIEGVDRATHVVQQLLTLSRMLPNSGLQDLELIDLNDKCLEVISLLKTDAIRKNIHLELITSEQPPLIEASATAIIILIRNLVDNAIRYTPENGSVKVVIEKSSDHIGLHVIDTGPGIPHELRSRVFERFFRIIGNNAKGSGLGLGIVQQIAQLHQAKVELTDPTDSESGLEVIVTFPSNNNAIAKGKKHYKKLD